MNIELLFCKYWFCKLQGVHKYCGTRAQGVSCEWCKKMIFSSFYFDMLPVRATILEIKN